LDTPRRRSGSSSHEADFCCEKKERDREIGKKERKKERKKDGWMDG